MDIDALIKQVCAYDAYVGASLRLIRAFGLRRKESVMRRPNVCIVPFESTGLAEQERQADQHVWIRQGAKNGRQRFVPLNTPRRVAAIEHAQTVASGPDAHLGNPNQDLKRKLRRFCCVLEKFGITVSMLGITAHGLRHEALIEEFVVQTGHQPPGRGGTDVPVDAERAARLAVSRLAGHSRPRASTRRTSVPC